MRPLYLSAMSPPIWRGLTLALVGVAIISGVSPVAMAFPPSEGTLDSTFGATGPGYTIIDFGSGANGHQDGAHRLLRQPDGNFVAVGSVDSAYGFGHVGIGLTRVLNNGQIDTTFGDGSAPAGRLILQPAAGADITGNGITFLPDGHLAVVGTYTPYLSTTTYGELFGFQSDGNGYWDATGIAGSAYNDVLTLPDGRIIVGGATPGAASSDYALVLYDNAGGLIDHLTVPFDLGGTNNDQAQRITFVSSINAASGRLGYVFAIGSVALPNYASGHQNIECGVVKTGLYTTAPRLRLEPSFGTGGKRVLDVNTAWSTGQSGAIDGNAYCRGLSVRKDGGLLVAGERYYFGYNNDHASADDSAGFAAKLDASGAVDPLFHNYGSIGNYAGGFAFYFQQLEYDSGLYQGLWFSLIQSNGLPLFGGLASLDCDGGVFDPRNRSWVLRTDNAAAQDATYSPYFCDAPRSAADTGFDVALDGVFDAGRVVTVGNVFSSLNPGSTTDFVLMRHYSDLIFTDNFDLGY